MRQLFSAQLNKVTIAILMAVVFLTPLLFTSLTTEFYETPKLIFLISAVLLLLLLTALEWVLSGKVTLTRTPVDLPLFLLLTVVILSTVFSNVRFVSILGNLPRVHGSTVAWVCYILLFFLATAHIRTKQQIRVMYYLILASVVVVSVIGILSYFGAYLPLPFTKFTNFSPAGSSFSAASLAILLLPLPLISIVRNNLFLPQPVAVATATLFMLLIALVGDTTTIVTGIIGVLITLFAIRIKDKGVEYQTSIGAEIFKKYSVTALKSLSLLLVPIVISLVVVALSYVPSFLGKDNPLYQKRLNFPREIQLSINSSWKIAASAFRDAPFLGTGPSTFLFDFSAYRPVEHNATRFWNIRFDVAFNEFFQSLATLGSLGLLALIFFAVMVVNTAIRGLKTSENQLSTALSISALLGVILLVLHVSSVVSIVMTLAFLAMLMATHKLSNSLGNRVEELSIGIKASKITDSNLVVGDVLPLILLIPILLLVSYVAWNGVPLVLADYHHRMALNSASTRGLETYNQLIRAVQLNPRADLYRTDLAQTNFALANAIARTKGPTESSPGGSLTEADKRDIQNLLSQSIQSGQAAVAINPLSAQNWEILGSIYRQISGVAQNALQFALDSYGRAIQRDPLNPVLRLNVGGIYYSIKNYDLAVRFFTDAVNLKPDFANGYYNLSVALRDKGDLSSAVLTAERVVSLLDPKTADYKTAASYLADLKARVATGSAQDQQTIPPAAQETSSLQRNDLPDVIDLPNKSDIATPPAVRRDNQASPSPSPQVSNP